MTPKQKAKELVDRFNEYLDHEKFSKRFAIVVYEQMIKEYQELARIIRSDHHQEGVEYWNEVKEEINKH